MTPAARPGGSRRSHRPARFAGPTVRESVDVEVRGTPVRVVRSSKRTKTVSAAWREGRLQVNLPWGLSEQAEQDWVDRMLTKVQANPASRPGANQDLLQRALRLARTHLDGEVQPTEVVWSTRQQHRWGSCTPSTGRIRISSELAEMPDWVLDAVIVHELTHLKHTGHTREFHDMAGRYPRQAEAMAFLAGVTYARGRGGAGAAAGQNEVDQVPEDLVD
ncbi:M48 family metallopeptidase [Micrococcus sp. IITD107]|uniref:M48 metallopeptidase family protein n=1 Tax=Micrococcus sp. IITD107 TaxID=3342790 RepID=UPI0035B86563